ncbi:MAG: Glutaredoxin, GrxC family [Candidatus Tokpelaia hoelldobleri]|uniref:Glutaredoxin n=1 Tax=Candidatus Tokpelaia hoelldobleri TaxID=1902579 RepID=A0A1U9JT23_9HYPH|nr:MAG: Glutaredoxin, GrxC family [Candidatus Tokpelaia hoelldoblerii]
MTDIILYTKSWCPYCNRAKALLGEKGADYTEIDIEEQPEKREEMIDRAGGKTTVPQIFINGKHIGGCDDLYALEEAGKLNALLK